MTSPSIRNVALVGSGDMGSAVAKSLADNGIRTLTCLEGRSERSRSLADVAGMTDFGSLENLCAEAEVFLSIIPPASALEFAELLCPLIRRSGKDLLFVDCNAVSPATVSRIAAVAERHRVRFQDVGIIGAAPRPERMPVRFYTSGKFSGEMQQLGTELINIKSMGEQIGRASAIKMVYASLTKGTHALRAAALMAGEELGVGAEVREEWAHSLPDVYRAMQKRLPILAADSARWTGEMREIADTYRSLGITPAFHEGAEWIYELLATTELANESRDEAGHSDRSIEETVRIFSDALKKTGA